MRDLDATVGVYADQMVVERGMIDLPKDDAVGDDRLTEQLVGIGHDVGRVQQMIIWQPAERMGDAVQRGAAAGRRRTRREPRARTSATRPARSCRRLDQRPRRAGGRDRCVRLPATAANLPRAGRQQSAVGETPKLAARLQAPAVPGVVVAPALGRSLGAQAGDLEGLPGGR